MNDTKFTLVGNAKFSRQPPPEEVEVFIQELQRLMNGFKVTKIDMALDPFNKGKIKFQHKGPNTINLN